MLYPSLTLEQLEILAEEFAHALAPPCCVLLYGDLGVGKSTFARTIIQTLTSKHTIVPSPTFTLLQTYETTSGSVTHFDLYRLHSTEEIVELGFDDYLKHHICLIEWPERIGDSMLKKYTKVQLTEASDNTRTITIERYGD